MGRGCGIYPRVHGDSDARISEEPVANPAALKYATTALAQMGGITPRKRVVDDNLTRLKREQVSWVQHDHERSSCSSKVLRPIRVAGVNSARLGYINQDS